MRAMLALVQGPSNNSLERTGDAAAKARENANPGSWKAS